MKDLQSILVDAVRKKFDEFDNVTPAQADFFTHPLELKALFGHHFRNGLDFVKACDERCERESESIADTARAVLPGIAFSVWTVLAQNETSIDECCKMPAQRLLRHSMGPQ